MGVSGAGKTTVDKTTVDKLLAVDLGLLFYHADDYHATRNIDKRSQGAC